MNIKYWVLVTILTLGVIFVTLDNCGNTDKYNRLKGEYETYYNMSRAVVAKSIAEINEQDKEIVILSKKVTSLHGIIEVKVADLADKEEELGELQREFDSLDECQEQYNKLADAFTLCKEITYAQRAIVFNLIEKYNRQLSISLEYKDMYESVQRLIDIRTKQVKELENINRRLGFTSKLKTGIVVVVAGVVLYSLLRK